MHINFTTNSSKVFVPAFVQNVRDLAVTHGPCVRENKELRRHGAARAYKEAASAAVVHCAFVGFSILTLESRVSTRTGSMGEVTIWLEGAQVPPDF